MAQASKLRVAIVGAGLMGRWHAHFASKAGATLSAIVDPDAQAATLLRRKVPRARIYADLSQCLHELEIDVVHVCAPTDSHYSLAQAGLEAGSHVLVEKPATQLATEACQLVNLAQRKGLKLNPVHQYPFQRGFQKLLRNMDRLGDLVRVGVNLCSAGGEGLAADRKRDLLLEILPHPFSVLYALFGKDLARCSWKVVTFGEDELEVHSTVNEIPLNISVSLRGRPNRNGLTIVGTTGSGHVDFFHGYSVIEDGEVSRKAKLLHPFRYGGALLVVAAANLIYRSTQRDWAFPGLGELTRRFYRSIADGRPVPITDEEIIGTAMLIDRLRSEESAPRSLRVARRRQGVAEAPAARGAGGRARRARSGRHASPLKLNLGSGNEPLDGYVNVDLRPSAGVNVVADVHRLPFAAASVQAVNASSLLEHFEDPYAVLDEIHRVLAPDGRLTARVPSPWAYIAALDRTHVFLADLKLWREILGGYFREVRAHAEGVRYRDTKLLALLNHFLVRVLGFKEYAQAWRLECRGTVPQPSRAYIPWWLEGRYPR